MMGGIERSAVADSVEPAPPVARPVVEPEAVDVVNVELVPGGNVMPNVALEVAIARRIFESARSREREKPRIGCLLDQRRTLIHCHEPFTHVQCWHALSRLTHFNKFNEILSVCLFVNPRSCRGQWVIVVPFVCLYLLTQGRAEAAPRPVDYSSRFVIPRLRRCVASILWIVEEGDWKPIHILWHRAC